MRHKAISGKKMKIVTMYGFVPPQWFVCDDILYVTPDLYERAKELLFTTVPPSGEIAGRFAIPPCGGHTKGNT